MRSLLALALALASAPGLVQACGFSAFGDLPGIEEVCCGGMEDPTCGEGFPALCSFECAELLVPFVDDCVKMMESMPPANFPFTIPNLVTFAASCRQTTELHHYSDGETCSESEADLEERVLDVNTACCTQEGQFSCGSTDGEYDDVPWGCNARCAVSFIPFYDECFRGLTVTTVDELEKYNLLYEQCANQGEEEVESMLEVVDSFLQNENCTINVTGITTRSGNFTIDRTVPEPCVDDDAALQAMMPGETCIDAAANGGIGCTLVGVPEICACSCAALTGGDPPPCVDDNRGLADLMGDESFTCLAAAASGYGCGMYGVATLCQCACPGDRASPPPAPPGGGHRRNERRRRRLQDASHLMVPSDVGGLISSQSCPMGEFLPRLQTVTAICCASQGGCTGTVPLACSFDCGRAFNDFLGTCGDLLEVFVPIYMPLYEEFASSCHNLDPRSLARAIHDAKCAECGDNYVDSFAGEECDDGAMNGHGACSTECKICSEERRLPSGGCVPEGADIWHSQGTPWAHNKAGHTFTLYLLPSETTYANDNPSADVFYNQCKRYNMLPAGNGNSDYSDQCASSTPRCIGENDGTGTACTLNAANTGCAVSGTCTGSDDGTGTPCATNGEGTGCAIEGGDCSFTRSCFFYDQPTCMPMVPSGWGSGNDCNNEMHNKLGWWNFIILEPATPAWKPVNFDGDAGSWGNTFRPVCGTDDVIDGSPTHPTGKVMEMETCDSDLRLSGGTSGMPSGGCVPTGTLIWHSVDTSWPTNQAGNNFAIYLLPEAEIWTNNERSADHYLDVCARHGMLPLGNGNSDYSNTCRDQHRCIPGWNTGFGGTSNYDDSIQSNIGWRNFIVLKWSDDWKPINYPSDESGWEVPKRPICATDDTLHGTVAHPSGIVPVREANCPVDRRLNSGACVPVGTEIWHSEGTEYATNQAGNAFTLYLLPHEQIWANNEDNADAYLELCGRYGMLPAGNGHSSNSNTCRDQHRCMPMVQDAWGSDADYDDHMHDILGWNNFIILQWGNTWKPINHPFDTSQWTAPKRPVCATDDAIHGTVSHPAGIVQELDSYGGR